jgi:hypothetical protein
MGYFDDYLASGFPSFIEYLFDRAEKEVESRATSAAISAAPTLPLAPTPTGAMPGTAEKIEVMTRRVADGQAIFHPRDAADKD